MAREVGVHDAQGGGNAELEAKLDEIRTELRMRAREAVHSALVLERIAVQENISAGEGEIDERIAESCVPRRVSAIALPTSIVIRKRVARSPSESHRRRRSTGSSSTRPITAASHQT